MPENIRADLQVNTSRVFKLGDVFFPDGEEVIYRTTPDLKLRGRIIDFSDSGRNKNEFAILQVDGIEGPVIVPVNKLKVVWEPEAEHEPLAE